LDYNLIPQAIKDSTDNEKLTDTAYLIGLKNNKSLLLIGKRLFFASSDKYEWDEININGFFAAAMCKLPGDQEIDKVCIALNP